MSQPSLSLRVLPGRLAVWQSGVRDPVPTAPAGAPLWAVVRTAGELSVVGPEAVAPNEGAVERGWRALEVVGPLDFELTGVLAELAAALAAAEVPVLAISTFDTDYVLVREERLVDAVGALRDRGHAVADQDPG